MPRPFLATCRVQLNEQFTLHDARARLPYLAKLGISHLYCSPILTARPGSVHGYDVTDPTQISEAIGGEDAFVALANAASAHGIGILLDIVPNHMGICADNPYWDDVLLHGADSRYAEWFDVAWRATARAERGKILLPILGSPLEAVIEHGEISLVQAPGGIRAQYFEHSFPINTASLDDESSLDRFAGGAEGNARLAKLLSRQHYRLAHWSTAQRDLNYRRFFDVNELVSLRVEREDVFNATHRMVLDLVERGLVHALRIDHIDGLLAPRRYLRRLRDAVQACQPYRGDAFPILVEKILAYDETLPPEWQTNGTTGYEFLTALDDVLLDENGIETIEAQYRSARDTGFESVAHDAKRKVLRTTLNADVRRLAPQLQELAREASWPTTSIAAYAGAIVEFVTELPVYRTYIDVEQQTATAVERRTLDTTLVAIRPRVADAAAFDALNSALVGDWSHATSNLARRRLSFVLRLQQLCGPAAAKGVEDTALYAYAPLTSRAEVGGDPAANVGSAIERLHELLRVRATTWPQSLNAATTHDTKRSADARARIAVLSEYPEEWRKALRRWGKLQRGQRAPNKRVRDFIFQSLLAIWPLATDPDNAAIKNRLTEYMRKAGREAKIATSWTNVNADYEAAVDAYIERLFDDAGARFRRGFTQLVERIDHQARWNMLARIVVQGTAPGVPDLYQGDELWNTSLVDPDNRRPVDWDAREAALARVGMLTRPAAATTVSDLKLAVVHALLKTRSDNADVFTKGEYRRVVVEGEHASRVIAFQREWQLRRVIVAVARTTRTLGDIPTGDVWGDTRLVVDGNRGFTCVLQAERVTVRDGRVHLRDAFVAIPAAVLIDD